MTYEDDLTTAAEMVAEAFGTIAITYTPFRGDAVSLSADIGEEQSEIVQDGDRQIKRLRRDVVIFTDSAGDYGGVANPEQKGKVTINGIDYSVAAIHYLPGDQVHLVCVRPERMERRHDYRGMQ
jgi:hypothetical protein